MKLSVVTTLYFSEAYVEEFYRRIVNTADQLTENYEIIFVNDGSPDASLQKAISLQNQDSRIIVVDLSRNFGHHKAILAGLGMAKGQRVFLLDVDLEEQPELLKKFWKEMDHCHADVVYGVQQKRKGSAFTCWCGDIFYKIINLLSETKIPENLCTIRLMTSDYVVAFLSLKEQSVYLAGNAAWVGFYQQRIFIEKSRRSDTSYTFFKKMQLSWNAITSFSSYPLWLSFFTGLMISIFSGCWGVIYLVERLLVQGTILPGLTSLLISIWFLGGLILFFVGLNGLYLSKIFLEVKGRPQYIIRDIYENKE